MNQRGSVRTLKSALQKAVASLLYYPKIKKKAKVKKIELKEKAITKYVYMTTFLVFLHILF